MEKRISQIISGDSEAFQLLIDEYSPLIKASLTALFYRYNRANPDDEAKELLNQFFLALMEDDFKKLKLFRGESSLATYLRVIATRLALDMMRKRKHDISNVPLETLDKNPGSCKTPEDHVEQISDLSLLQQTVKQLPATEQLLLKLVYEQELDAREVATILHLSLSAYYSRKSRIIKKLKNMCKKAAL